ncbi:UvrD-helicase domain-containing protein [Lutimonas zeaxanthinifaciens]|uniref:UvrD-helicase domain-containing protein n=1 Tax=Lutimonas zeaxanthinifaciens TaxID=3060215 RepID=UPI00265CBB4A|nr:UvrD-helicase domain-containing protein [Lutimonas sp. YSD2104]WKK65844.1 UvrD-helicase domain-containing protein [Lutimonas sp. YSD2104]
MIYPSTFKVYNASAGSGKTFTLVKEYLKIILSDPNVRSYQNILAITFTNKAATEMKDRILESLLEFSMMTEGHDDEGMISILVEETGLDSKVIQKRAKEKLQDILKNYASFHIKTIDSFTNKLIKSFAFDLNLTSDFEVELDADSILREAVDEVLSQIGIDKELTRLLIDFSREKTLEDKSWDVSRDLYEVSKLILNENHSKELDALKNKNISDFSDLSLKLRKSQKHHLGRLKQIGENALDLIDQRGIEHSDFYYSQLPKFFKKLLLKPVDKDFKAESSTSKNLEKGIYYTKNKPEAAKSAIDSIINDLIGLYWESLSVFREYKLNDMILKNLVPLAVIKTINQALEAIKINNNIRLNSEFNQLISDHLINEPAAFIYEKLGERFKFFFIDEMQDTSELQWNNLIPLVDNALSSEKTGLMLVGDAKQAIYRWRGGHAEQFINLSSEKDRTETNPFQIQKTLKNLDTNYRSHREIIQFNNGFFSHIGHHFEPEKYKSLYRIGNNQKTNSKEGGFVRLQFTEPLKNNDERNEVYPKLVYETIEELLTQFDASEICILVRKKKEGAAIAKFLTEKGVDIVSSETLMLKNNTAVNFIINMLQLFEDEDNEDAKFEILEFLYQHLGVKEDQHGFFTSMLKLNSKDLFKALEKYGVLFDKEDYNQYSILEGVEELIRSFRLTRESDSFLQFFMDFVFDYSQRKSQKNISFLAFWEEKKEKLNIVNSEDIKAVRIMTIHKSKGLEFPVVIYPYNMALYDDRDPKAWLDQLDKERFLGFDKILVNSGSAIRSIGEYGEEIYEKQQRERQLDSYNLLYVCLTRAVEQLYVISEIKSSKEGLRNSSELFMDYLEKEGIWKEEILCYEFGEMLRSGKHKSDSKEAEMQRDFISSSWKDHQIHIVTNSELLWDSQRGEAIGYGNLIHEIMEAVKTWEDVENALSKFVARGLLDLEKKEEMRHLIHTIICHPDLREYYKPGLKIMNEREILSESGEILIPDRLVFNEDEVVVIDYKTGQPNSSHKLQVENYASVLRKMNYKVKEKVIIYLDKEIKIIKS